MKEQWKTIGEYEVSSLGNIRKLGQQELIRPYKDKDGYLIYNNNRIHRLVAQAFIPNPDNLSEVNHIDYNRSNNMVNNLEWVSHQQNCAHSSIHYGKHCQVLTDTKAEEIRQKYFSQKVAKKAKGKKYTMRSLAKEYGCHHETIRQLILNNTYNRKGGD